MGVLKSILKLFRKIFRKKKNGKKNKPTEQLTYETTDIVKILNETILINDDDNDNLNIQLATSSLKRIQTCSFDLSDKSLRMMNSLQLTNVNAPSSLHRTSSFNMDRDFQKKMLLFSDFDEKEVVGEGAFGRAIKVEHRRTGLAYVLKEVVSHSKENEESIIREIALLRSLRHYNILNNIGLVIKDKSICLLTELMEGGCLQSRIENFNEEISLNLKLSFLRDIAAGMSFLHQNSIMHRDLTSVNCLLRKNNSVVVCDFGLSKFLTGDTDHNALADAVSCSSLEAVCASNKLRQLTNLEGKKSFHSVGNFKKFEINPTDYLSLGRLCTDKNRSRTVCRKHTVVGNAFWMAPEMLAGKSYNCLVDVYSFGIIGCEVIARVSAHPDFLERVYKDMSVNFSAFVDTHKDHELSKCPQELIGLVEACCNVDPDQRPNFDTALSCIEDLLFKDTNNIQMKIKWSNED